jgi:hypothetical protein
MSLFLREYSVLRKFLALLGLRGGIHTELKSKQKNVFIDTVFTKSTCHRSKYTLESGDLTEYNYREEKE